MYISVKLHVSSFVLPIKHGTVDVIHYHPVSDIDTRDLQSLLTSEIAIDDPSVVTAEVALINHAEWCVLYITISDLAENEEIELY